MSKYSMVMSWSEEDQAYIVSVPELPGCMAFRAMRRIATINLNSDITL